MELQSFSPPPKQAAVQPHPPKHPPPKQLSTHQAKAGESTPQKARPIPFKGPPPQPQTPKAVNKATAASAQPGEPRELGYPLPGHARPPALAANAKPGEPREPDYPPPGTVRPPALAPTSKPASQCIGTFEEDEACESATEPDDDDDVTCRLIMAIAEQVRMAEAMPEGPEIKREKSRSPRRS